VRTECINAAKLGEVVDLPADHPAWRHVEDCPRCRNLVRSYREFMQAEAPAGSGIDGARRRLDALIDAKAVETPSVPRPNARPWWRMVLRPGPVLAAGAAAIVVIAALALWRPSREPGVPVLRDNPVSQEAALPPADVRPDGSIHLSWAAVAGAERYQVRIYGPDLAEIYRHPDVTETSVVVDRALLPSDLPPRLDLMWRVYALQSGDVVHVSAPGSIRIR
jgi:hypothetical protein